MWSFLKATKSASVDKALLTISLAGLNVYHGASPPPVSDGAYRIESLLQFWVCSRIFKNVLIRANKMMQRSFQCVSRTFPIRAPRNIGADERESETIVCFLQSGSHSVCLQNTRINSEHICRLCPLTMQSGKCKRCTRLLAKMCPLRFLWIHPFMPASRCIVRAVKIRSS